MDKQKIIDKVVKLLNLAESSNFKEEAKTAKEQAAALMAKYDISTLEAVKKEQFDRVESDMGTTDLFKYDNSLINSIANFNGVGYVYRDGYVWGSERKNGVNIFIGLTKDIECTSYMIDVVKQQRTYAWKKHLKEIKAEWGFHPGDKYRMQWMQGFSYGLRTKLNELKRMKENKVQEHGLVPVDAAEQAMIFYKKDNKVSTTKQRSSEYVAAGYTAGKNTSIHEGITKQTDVKKIS